MRGLYGCCLMNIQYFSHLLGALFQRLSLFILICGLLGFYSIKKIVFRKCSEKKKAHTVSFYHAPNAIEQDF